MKAASSWIFYLERPDPQYIDISKYMIICIHNMLKSTDVSAYNYGYTISRYK